MSEIIFHNQAKYAKAVRMAGKGASAEAILQQYVRLAGMYFEDGVPKNVIGNPAFLKRKQPGEPTQAERVSKAQEKAKEAAKKGIRPKSKTLRGKRLVAVKPTLKKK